MPNENLEALPNYLSPLLEPTPSGVAKLLAAWDGLNTELQSLILTALETSEHPGYLTEKVRMKALDSTNAYVRYLAARRIYFGRENSEEKLAIKQRIENDSSPLVQYCLLERGWGLFARELADADAFFALPHDARLAKIRFLRGSGAAMANLIGHAVDHQLKDGTVSVIELFEILSDYVNKTEFKTYYASENESNDGFTEYSRGKDIDALWRLVLKVPEVASHVLIEKLPPSAGLGSGIPEDVLSGMSSTQLIALFTRVDIQLEDLRKKIFREATNDRDELKAAAIRYHFDLDYAEFADILAVPKNETDNLLRDLTRACNLSLCIYEAIRDFTLASSSGDPLTAEFARDAFDRRLKELTGWQRKKQLRNLYLYHLAKTAVPWRTDEAGYLPSGELAFLSKVVVEGNTWGTFISYATALENNTSDSRILEKYLDNFDDPVEEEARLRGDGRDDKYTELLDRIEEKITETVLNLIDKTENKQTEPTGTVKHINTDLAQMQASEERQTQLLDEHLAKVASRLIEKTNEIKKQMTDHQEQLSTKIARLQAAQQRHGLVVYLIIGLLGWLILKLV